MIESLFFVLFSVTFLFILLLVYHFKNKISALEKKNETMFDILNNVVSELTDIKRSITPSGVINSMVDSRYGGQVEYGSEQQEESIEDDDDDEEESDRETDNDEETVDDEEESDDEETDEDDEEDSDDEQEEEEEVEEVKTISIELNEQIDSDAINSEEILEDPEFIEEIDPVLDVLQEQTISVEKIEEEKVENTMDDYKKMHVQNLKKLVLSKGLSEDPSKLKKAELLALLKE